MNSVEMEILRVAATLGAVIHKDGGPNDLEIASLETQGCLKLDLDGSDEASGVRRFKITKKGRVIARESVSGTDGHRGA